MNYISNKYDTVGFGMSKEEADNDSYLNMCRKDIQKDSERKYIIRRKEVNPWLPLPNILQFPGIGCLVYRPPLLFEQKSGKSMMVDTFKKSIFYYVMSLTEGALNYADIMVSFQEEIDIFFKNIAKEFDSLNEYPVIKCVSTENGFSSGAVYTLNGGVLIGVSSDYVGIKTLGCEWYYAVDRVSQDSLIPAIYYLAARAGIVLSEKGEVLNVRQD